MEQRSCLSSSHGPITQNWAEHEKGHAEIGFDCKAVLYGINSISSFNLESSTVDDLGHLHLVSPAQISQSLLFHKFLHG